MLLEKKLGFVVLRLEGKGVARLLETESGGHRVQRVPPTEKRGRVHTSTITVVAIPGVKESDFKIDLKDVDFCQFGGTGPGGQGRNKSENCIRAVHRPTGIEAKSESERSQKQNRELALSVLESRVLAARQAESSQRLSEKRKLLAGTGMRGDKCRTLRYQDDVVTCHRSGRKARLKDYLRGDLSWLFL